MVPTATVHENVAKGEALYNEWLRAIMETPENLDKILVLDVDTGDYVIDESHLAAVRKMKASCPKARLYSVRIGYPALAKIGGSWRMRQTPR
jgi:hypothetical protein